MTRTKPGRRGWGTIRKLPSGRFQASYLHRGQRHNAPKTYAVRDAAAELIEDAVFPSGLLAPETLTGNVDVDLQPYCLLILRHLSDPAVRSAIPGLLTEYQTDPLLWQRVVERSVIPMRRAFRAWISRRSAMQGTRSARSIQASIDSSSACRAMSLAFS